MSAPRSCTAQTPGKEAKEISVLYKLPSLSTATSEPEEEGRYLPGMAGGWQCFRKITLVVTSRLHHTLQDTSVRCVGFKQPGV